MLELEASLAPPHAYRHRRTQTSFDFRSNKRFFVTLFRFLFSLEKRVRIQRHRTKLELIRLKCSIVNDFHKEFTHMWALNTSTWNGFQFVSIEICVIENPFGAMCSASTKTKLNSLSLRFQFVNWNDFRYTKWECEFDSLVLRSRCSWFHRKSRSNNGLIEHHCYFPCTHNCWLFNAKESERKRHKTEFEWITHTHLMYTSFAYVMFVCWIVHSFIRSVSSYPIVTAFIHKTISINRIMPAWMFMSLLNVIMIIDHNSHSPSLTLLLLVIYACGGQTVCVCAVLYCAVPCVSIASRSDTVYMHRLRLERCRIDRMIIVEQNAHFIVHIPTQTHIQMEWLWMQ